MPIKFRPMFEALLQDSSLLSISIIIAVLIGIAYWRGLNKAALAIFGVYIVYLIFSISTTPEYSYEKLSLPTKEASDIVEEKMPNNKYSLDKGKDEIKIIDSIATIPEELNEKVPLQEDNQSVMAYQQILISDSTESINKTDSIVKKSFELPNSIDLQKETPIKIMSIAFGREVVIRDLVDLDTLFTLSDAKIYCMTKIQNLGENQLLYHNWYQSGRLRSKIEMEVGRSYNWRTWSYINVRPDKIGKWKVVITDVSNVRYDSLSFEIRDQ